MSSTLQMIPCGNSQYRTWASIRHPVLPLTNQQGSMTWQGQACINIQSICSWKKARLFKYPITSLSPSCIPEISFWERCLPHRPGWSYVRIVQPRYFPDQPAQLAADHLHLDFLLTWLIHPDKLRVSSSKIMKGGTEAYDNHKVLPHYPIECASCRLKTETIWSVSFEASSRRCARSPCGFLIPWSTQGAQPCGWLQDDLHKGKSNWFHLIPKATSSM